MIESEKLLRITISEIDALIELVKDSIDTLYGSIISPHGLSGEYILGANEEQIRKHCTMKGHEENIEEALEYKRLNILLAKLNE